MEVKPYHYLLKEHTIFCLLLKKFAKFANHTTKAPDCGFYIKGVQIARALNLVFQYFLGDCKYCRRHLFNSVL